MCEIPRMESADKKKGMRFAVVGCGVAGKLHAMAIQRSTRALVRVLVDTKATTASSLAQELKVDWSANMFDVLGDPTVDAVSIALPHALHYEAALAALNAGKHVLLEKPFTLSTTSALRLVDAAKAQQVVIAPWLERRFLPIAEEAQRVVASGILGRLVYLRISCVGYKPRAYWHHGVSLEEEASDWRTSKAQSGGGILIMNAIHQIDLARFITALDAESVSAQTETAHHQVEVEDTAVLAIRYRDGCLGTLEASCAAFGGQKFPIEGPGDMIAGTNGTLQLGENLRVSTRYFGSQARDFPATTITMLKTRLIDHFIQRVEDGGPLRNDPRDAVQALGLVNAAYASADLRRSVNVGEATEATEPPAMRSVSR